MFWRRKAKPTSAKRTDLSAYIDEASEIEGTYRFNGTVMLNGRFSGEISSTDTLIIGDKGVVRANVEAGIVLVSGEVVGNIRGGERVELRGGARVFGDVEAPVVVVEEGVVFDGHCRMKNARGEARTGPARDLSVVAVNQ